MQASPLGDVIPNFESPTLQGFDLNNVRDGQRINGIGRQLVRFFNYKGQKIVADPKHVKIDPKTGATQVLKTKMVPFEREMVEIVTPGDKNTVCDFAEDFHRREHFRHYQAFRDGKTAPIGIPIEEMEWISPNIATELRYLGIHVVEQLAGALDYAIQRIPNGFELREYAKSVCKHTDDAKSEVEDLRKEVMELRALIGEKRSPGRPKKTDKAEDEENTDTVA